MKETSQADDRGRIGLYRLGTMLLALLVASSFLVAPAAAAGDVTITVEEQDGDAVEGATVTLYDASDDSEVNSSTTDADGNVTFAGEADGDYYAVVEDDGYLEAESGTITVSAAAATETVTVDEELVNETVSIDDDTQTLWGELEADNESDMTVVFYGINTSSDAGDVELANETVTVGAGNASVLDYELTDADLEEYDEARIVVGGSADDVNSTDYGTTISVSGGGGSSSDGLLSYSVYGIPAVAVLVVALGGAYAYTRD